MSSTRLHSLLRLRLRRPLTHLRSVADFYNGYILGYFDEMSCPNYLKKENFATMQKNLKASKLTLYVRRERSERK